MRREEVIPPETKVVIAGYVVDGYRRWEAENRLELGDVGFVAVEAISWARNARSEARR